MKIQLINLGAILLTSMILSGCVKPEYTESQLMNLKKYNGTYTGTITQNNFNSKKGGICGGAKIKTVISNGSFNGTVNSKYGHAMPLNDFFKFGDDGKIFIDGKVRQTRGYVADYKAEIINTETLNGTFSDNIGCSGTFKLVRSN